MRKAFTLVELLVVVSIVATLAAILFPVFAQAKAAAKNTVCLNNLKQLGAGVLLYAVDADDHLPGNKSCQNAGEDSQNASDGQCIGDQGENRNGPGGLGWLDPTAGRNWAAATFPYVRALPLYLSPLASRITDGPSFRCATASGAGNTTYFYNAVLMDKASTVVDDPTGTILLTGQQQTDCAARLRPRRTFSKHGDADWNGYVEELNRDFSLETYHHGGTLAYTDGHARWRPHNAVRYREYGVGGAPDRGKSTWKGPLALCDVSVVSADQTMRLDGRDSNCPFPPRF